MDPASSQLEFYKGAVADWATSSDKNARWPVVYVLSQGTQSATGRLDELQEIYVGESLNIHARLRQHLDTSAKKHLLVVRVITGETFNKSVCLDLEAYLIRMLAGDGKYQVLNRNDGIMESNYYQREVYRARFRNVFDRLAEDGLFTQSITEIESSDLFKMSPFKALTEDQANSVDEIIQDLLTSLGRGTGSTMVIQGGPGTGKTVVAIYLIKLLTDVRSTTSSEDFSSDSQFSYFFTEQNRRLLRSLRIGLVIPQQSLRESIKKVFRKTPGLDPSMVLTPFQVGKADARFDLLLVDETHRLNQRANQPSGVLNAQFVAITKDLFGVDDTSKTQLDWIRRRSRHQIFLLDEAQSVRPADLPREVLSALVAESQVSRRYFSLHTQMRVRAGPNFVSYIRSLLNPDLQNTPQAVGFEGYDFRIFGNLADMQSEIFRRERETGLARMVAGYAWPWKTKSDKNAFDIEIGQTQLRWNSTPTDWIASSKALEEVGSIHTVQGYDLNYVGVIIGLDLRFNAERQRLWVARDSYFDKKGKENNPVLGKTYSDGELLCFVTQIYGVLMTRGIMGTYVYACDPGLREYLRAYIPGA